MSFDIMTALPAVSVEKTKQHCKIDHDLEDALIEAYIMAATQRAEQICGREIIKRVDENALCDSQESVPAGVQAWIMCEVSDLFENRGNSVSGKSDGRRNFDHLLDAFREF